MHLNSRQWAAWAVHALTASGAVWGLLAILAIGEGAWQRAFVWMVIALGVDGMDGMLARRALVTERTPDFDGALLDNIVDYLNYVIVPAFFFVRAEVLPESWRLPVAVAICLASAYQFCQRDAKTPDHFFRGFPSYWNIVALYSYYLALTPGVNLAILGGLIFLVFVPLKWIYPSRMLRWRAPTMALTLVWCLAMVAVVWLDGTQKSDAWVLWLARISMSYVGFYVVASLILGRDTSDQTGEALAVVPGSS